MVFKSYCKYDALKPILVAHCYLAANNKAETTSDEDSYGDYDNSKGRFQDGGYEEGSACYWMQ